MNILLVNSENIQLKGNNQHKLIILETEDISIILKKIHKLHIDAIIIDCSKSIGGELIKQIKARNDVFPCIALISTNDPTFPELINPFHCLSLQEIKEDRFILNLETIVSNYKKKVIQAKDVLNTIKEAQNVKEYSLLTNADSMMVQLTWGSYIKPTRFNPIVEKLDKMINIMDNILDTKKNQ